MRKFLRRSLIGLACPLGIWFLVHVVEGIRGRHAMRVWVQERDTSASLPALDSVIPIPVKDEENFAKAPIVLRVLHGEKTHLTEVLKLPKKDGAMGRWSQGRPADLDAWAETYGTLDLLKSLEPLNAPLKELDLASRRTGSRLFEAYVPSRFSRLGNIEVLNLRPVIRTLNLRALAKLKARRSQEALDDVLLGLRISQHLQKEPESTTYLICKSFQGLLMQGIWEGLNNHAWDARQLACLQKELAKSDPLTSLYRMLVWERWTTISAMEEQIKARNPTTARTQWEEQWRRVQEEVKLHPDADLQAACNNLRPNRVGVLVGDAVMPKGWIFQNEVRADRVFADHLLKSVDIAGHRIQRQRLEEIPSWWSQGRRTPYTFLAAPIPMDYLTRLVSQAARQQAYLDQAIVVCALERFRIEHHDYPGSLQLLTPEYIGSLPPDVATGEALHYLRSGPAGFRLYSVAWDGKDDGGKLSDNGESPTDWPWPPLTP